MDITSLFNTPEICLGIGIMLTMLVSVIRIHMHRPAQIFAILTLLATAISAVYLVPSLSQTFTMLFAFVGVLFCIGNSRYLTREGLNISDYYHLFLILILGAVALVSSQDLLTSFIALEVLSIPAYALAGFRRNDPRSNESAVKYFVLGSVAGAMFLLGATFLFGATGSLKIQTIYQYTQAAGSAPSPLFAVGQALVIIAFLFKVAAAPLHFWKPDVYEGAPLSVTGIMATIISAAGFVALARLVHLVDYSQTGWSAYSETVKIGLRGAALASLFVGMAIAITQMHLKRFFAYSSIANTGYLLLGLLASIDQPEALESVFFYLIGYSIMTAGAFVLMSQTLVKADQGLDLVDLTGLMKRNPFQTFLWGIFLFSMAGVPLTVGFVIKYSVFLAAVKSHEGAFVAISCICAVIGAYAYLRPFALMVMRDVDADARPMQGSFASTVSALLAALLVLALGIHPEPLLQSIKGMGFGGH